MIFIGFRDKIGRIDVGGVVKHINKHKGKYSEVYFLHRKPLHPAVEKLIHDAGFKHILTKNFNTEIAKLKEKGKVEVHDFDDFGDRVLSRDIC